MNPFIWAVVVSTIGSGFFALIDYSMSALRRIQLEDAFEADGEHSEHSGHSGKSGKNRQVWLNDNLRALKLAVSLLRSLSNLVLMVAMLRLFAGPEVNYGFVVVLGAIVTAGAIIALFGTAIPHAWAAYAGEKILSVTYPVLKGCRYLMYPVTAVMQSFDLPIRRLVGIADEEPENGQAAKQEILQAASEGQAEGAVKADQVEMIESVMEFGDTHTGQIMTPRTDVFALPIETPWDSTCRQIVEAGHTRVPVYQDNMDNIIGILYAKDLLRHVTGETPPELRSIMRKPYFVPETMALSALLREFKARKVHLAVVLDEYGGTAGIVSIEDVIEEIVGEISDEYDHPEPALIHRIDPKAVQADGRLHIDDLNDAMGLDISEDDDYDTVAGFVFSEFGYIPAVNETLEAHGAKFTVLAADERKITKLRIELLKEQRP